MRRGGTVSGAVSLVMIFCVLCLSVFAVLTLATANREQTLADLAADRAAAYYAADSQAVALVSALREGRDLSAASGTEEAVLYTDTDAGTVAEFSLPAGGEQRLEVRVLLGEDGTAEILQWKTVFGGEWETSDLIELWDF